MEIKNLQPECIWRNFDALTQVPRPSGHLDKVQQFLLDFAKRVGVEAFKDEANNIVMRKPASEGMENKPGIILQAHMDMVPQKAPDSTHNFETDPIQTYIDEEGWVRAKGTTLGADNGLGVAAIMAVMEDKTLKHGPVEGLITADEETGLYGANNLPADELHGDILLNLDSEHWGKFVIGVQDPQLHRGENLATVREPACSAVTSGIYERFLIKNGRRYHHLLDPRTGYPLETDLSSVTVFTDQSVMGEIEAKRLFFNGEPITGWKARPGNRGAIFIHNDESMVNVGFE